MEDDDCGGGGAACDGAPLSAMGAALQKTMASVFGYREFRGDQVEVMESIIAGVLRTIM